MKFYIKKYQHPIPDSVRFPAMVLVPNTWNDYGYIITFRLFYYETASRRKEIGDVKILDKRTNETELPDRFSKLSASRCSLGQSLDYYHRLKRYFPENYLDIHNALNDVAVNVGLRDNFENLPGFSTALQLPKKHMTKQDFSCLKIKTNKWIENTISATQYYWKALRQNMK